jgi:Skp family chaperone for outer membrane proteins
MEDINIYMIYNFQRMYNSNLFWRQCREEMKRATGCLIALFFIIISSAVIAAEQKICVVDMEKVFTNYYKTKLEDTKIKKQTEVFKDYLKVLGDARGKIEASYVELRDASQNIGLSDVERENKRIEAQDKYRELQAKDVEIQQYNQQKRQLLVNEYDRIRKELIKEIVTVIQSRAKREGYTFVFDYSGNSMNNISTIVYYDQAKDITDVVLKEVNLGNGS